MGTATRRPTAKTSRQWAHGNIHGISATTGAGNTSPTAARAQHPPTRNKPHHPHLRGTAPTQQQRPDGTGDPPRAIDRPGVVQFDGGPVNRVWSTKGGLG